MTTHFQWQGESTLAPSAPAHALAESRPASLTSRMLQRLCLESGAARACLLNTRNETLNFEDGYEMASQVFQNVVKQLFWGSDRHQIHKVVLGLKEKLCLIIELPGQRQHRKFILALFAPSAQITPYLIGRMEGIAQTWLEIGPTQPAHIPQMVEACSVCDRLETHKGWLRWDAFLHSIFKRSVSHKICEDCACDLYDQPPTLPDATSFQVQPSSC